MLAHIEIIRSFIIEIIIEIIAMLAHIEIIRSTCLTAEKTMISHCYIFQFSNTCSFFEDFKKRVSLHFSKQQYLF